MADRKRYQKSNNATNDLQNKELSSVRSQSEEKVPDAGGLRFEVLNGAPFLFHNSHIRSGRRKDAGCGVCGYKMENFVISVEKAVSESEVGESDRTDDESSTPSALDSSLSRIFGV